MTKDIRVLNDPPYFEEVKGIDKVFNWIRKALLSTYDSEKDYGCYLKSIIGQNIYDEQELVNNVIREVERVEQQLIDRQLEADHPIPKSEQVKEMKLRRIHRIDEELKTDIEAPFNGYVRKTRPLRIVSNDGERRGYNLSSFHNPIVQDGDVFKKRDILAVSELGDLYNIGVTFEVLTREGELHEGELFPK